MTPTKKIRKESLHHPKTAMQIPPNLGSVCSWHLVATCVLCKICLIEQQIRFFRKNGKDRSAADTYCKALKTLVNSTAERAATVFSYIRKDHFHPHGTRKGPSTHVTTNTMDPPPMPSILFCGEWRLGKVSDLYWKWSHLGDCYVGRSLSGLDPDSEEFNTLPPHFIADMDNDYIM